MRLDEFDFELPEALIALRPVEPRSASRLLEVRPSALVDAHVADLPSRLRAGDVLVFNDTRVIPARLGGVRRRDGSEVRVEATLLTRERADIWRALAKPGKRLRVGDRIDFDGLTAEITEKAQDGGIALRFDRSGPELDAAIAQVGAMPLPPYISARRAPDLRDRVDYQTILAAKDGAVAAPTAALHFDADLLAAVEAAGAKVLTVTLHVGAGTFLPVKAERIEDHRMHAEIGEVSEETAAAVEAARRSGGRVFAVGTTVLRVLETAAAETGVVRPWRGATDLFVTPGFQFRAVDALMTNFHLPRSTLMLLVAAFVGRERILAAYAHAIRERYRFYSYGDSSLLWRA